MSSAEMAVLSVLRVGIGGLRGLQNPLISHALALTARSSKPIVPTCARGMAHKKTMQILPSKYEYTKWKDMLHFYTALGLIPLGMLIAYVNIFIGSAELIDIPDGYEPKHWEYHQHPIKRFFARYVHPNPQKDYEKMCHDVYHEQEKIRLRALEKKIKALMAERGDYKGWYYMPAGERHAYIAKYVHDDKELTKGYGPP